MCPLQTTQFPKFSKPFDYSKEIHERVFETL